jgi:hypothetical protein
VLVSEMLSEVRDHGFDDLTDTRILGFINDTYYDVCSREPWPFLEASASLTVDATGLVTVPTDIGAILSIVNTSTGDKLEPLRSEEFRQNFASSQTDAGNPLYYYFLGNSLHVHPLSTSSPLQAIYVRVPAALTASPDSSPILPVQHHRVLVLGALVKCGEMEDDAELAAMFTNNYEQRITQMRHDLWMRQYDRPDTIADLDPVDWVDLLY